MFDETTMNLWARDLYNKLPNLWTVNLWWTCIWLSYGEFVNCDLSASLNI
jgi:hypothetical protein